MSALCTFCSTGNDRGPKEEKLTADALRAIGEEKHVSEWCPNRAYKALFIQAAWDGGGKMQRTMLVQSV